MIINAVSDLIAKCITALNPCARHRAKPTCATPRQTDVRDTEPNARARHRAKPTCATPSQMHARDTEPNPRAAQAYHSGVPSSMTRHNVLHRQPVLPNHPNCARSHQNIPDKYQ